MELSVDEILALDELQGTQLLAGAGGIYRTVRTLSVLEVPNDYEVFLQGGELVLTTFHSLLNDVTGQVKCIRVLAKAEAAGLAIHPILTGTRITDEVLEAADAYALPLMLLPVSISYATVFFTVFRAILARHERNNFLSAVLEGEISSEGDLRRKGSQVGLDLTYKRMLIVVKPHIPGLTWIQCEPMALLGQIRKIRAVSFCESPLALSRSYREVSRVLDIGEKMYGPGCVVSVRELWVFALLDQIPRTALEQFTDAFVSDINPGSVVHESGNTILILVHVASLQSERLFQQNPP